VHHADGTCASFADGHVEHWRWTDPQTVAAGRIAARLYIFNEDPVPMWPGWNSSPENPDALRVNKAIWGKWPLGPRIDGGQ
jgi:prepilin-type processing-associated H-X9-DG protein